jgi:hypothetical protein
MDGNFALNATQVSSDMLWTSIASNNLASTVFVRLSPALACGALSCGALQKHLRSEVQRRLIGTFRSRLTS